MNNFKSIVSKANVTRYPWPEGWERNDKVAKDLNVSPDRVRGVLKPAIEQGLVECQVVAVWNPEKHRVDRVTGWRAVQKPEVKRSKKTRNMSE
jgi:hypothetical protein